MDWFAEFWDNLLGGMAGPGAHIPRQAPQQPQGSGFDIDPWRPAIMSVPILGTYAMLAIGEEEPTPSARLTAASSPVDQEIARATSSPIPSASASGPSPAASTPGSPQATAPPQASGDAVVAAEIAAAMGLNPALAQAAQDQGNPLYGSVPDGRVLISNKTPADAPRYGRSPTAMKVSGTWQSIAEAIASVNDWDAKKVDGFMTRAIGAGLISKPSANLDDVEQLWGALVIRAAKMNERGIKITPWQLLERYQTGSVIGGGAASQARTVTSTAVNYMDTPTAKATIRQALQGVFGRDPTKKESETFIAAFRAAEKKNPTTSTTTTNADGTNVSTSTKQGLNPAAFAQDWAMGHDKNEAASYQASTYYMSAFFDALKAPV